MKLGSTALLSKKIFWVVVVGLALISFLVGVTLFSFSNQPPPKTAEVNREVNANTEPVVVVEKSDNKADKISEKKPEPSVTVLVFGDLMLDRYVRMTIQKKGLKYVFANIERFLLGSDLVLANLEGSFTDFAPNPDPNSLKFTFDPKLISELKKLGFNIFNLANNHSLDFGAAGFTQSKELLKKNNLDYFGDPKNISEISIIKNVRGLKIGWVGYNGLIGKIDPILEEVKKIKQEADIVAVYTHWGAEYNENFTKTQQDQARAIIDAGADVIFGSHPHVVEPMEEYKGPVAKLIKNIFW